MLLGPSSNAVASALPSSEGTLVDAGTTGFRRGGRRSAGCDESSFSFSALSTAFRRVARGPSHLPKSSPLSITSIARVWTSLERQPYFHWVAASASQNTGPSSQSSIDEAHDWMTARVASSALGQLANRCTNSSRTSHATSSENSAVLNVPISRGTIAGDQASAECADCPLSGLVPERPLLVEHGCQGSTKPRAIRSIKKSHTLQFRAPNPR